MRKNTSTANLFRKLTQCENGSAVSFELLLVSVVAVVGLVVAMSTVRDTVVSELRDASLSVQNSNQSIAYNGTSGASGSTAGSGWSDQIDSIDGEDVAGVVLGIDFDIAPEDEGSNAELINFIENTDFTFLMQRFGSSWTGTVDFDNGTYTAVSFWPGSYTIEGTIINVVFNGLGFGWDDGSLVLDASDTDNINGNVTWINSISGFVWEATYRLFEL